MLKRLLKRRVDELRAKEILETSDEIMDLKQTKQINSYRNEPKRCHNNKSIRMVLPLSNNLRVSITWAVLLLCYFAIRLSIANITKVSSTSQELKTEQLITSTTNPTTAFNEISDVAIRPSKVVVDQHRLPPITGGVLIGKNSSNLETDGSCSRAKRDLDRCSAQMLALGLGSSQKPHSMDDMTRVYCPKIKKLSTCIKDNSKCYSRFEKQIIE